MYRFVRKPQTLLRINSQTEDTPHLSPPHVSPSSHTFEAISRPLLKVTNRKGSNLLPRLVRTTWESTVKEHSLQDLFPDPPMVVYRRNKNLANHLVRAATPGEVEPTQLTFKLPEPILYHRVHPCGHVSCKCCKQLFNTYNIKGIPLTQHLNCKSRNIVYLLKCRQHPRSINVGQTGRQLNQRLANHRGALVNPGHKRKWPLYI